MVRFRLSQLLPALAAALLLWTGCRTTGSVRFPEDPPGIEWRADLTIVPPSTSASMPTLPEEP